MKMKSEFNLKVSEKKLLTNCRRWKCENAKLKMTSGPNKCIDFVFVVEFNKVLLIKSFSTTKFFISIIIFSLH